MQYLHNNRPMLGNQIRKMACNNEAQKEFPRAKMQEQEELPRVKMTYYHDNQLDNEKVFNVPALYHFNRNVYNEI